MQRVAEAPRLRLDRTHRLLQNASTTQDAKRPAPAPPAIVQIENPAFLVAIVLDMPGGRLSRSDRQLLGAGRILAGGEGATIAIVEGNRDDDIGHAGADRVSLVSTESNPEVYDPDGRAQAISTAIATLSPRHVLFAETPDGGDLARRVALLLDEPLFPDADLLAQNSVARASQGRRVEQRCAPPRLISLMPEVVPAYSGAPREGRHVPLTLPRANAGAILSSKVIPADPASVPLALADFVTAAGNGITDLAMFQRLVAALGATPGASRVLCDTGRMPRAAQVGASGTVLSATCYFALGIAGAPQHLQGVADCAHVVAVNTDLHAAMIARAGLAIVQDAQRVMPALVAELAREAEATR